MSDKFQIMYCWLSNHPRHYCTYYLLCWSFLITQNLFWVWTYNYSHHYKSWNSLFPIPTYHMVRVIGLSFSQRICPKIAWQIGISPISSKDHWIAQCFPKNFISIKTNDSQIFDNQSIPNIDDIPTNYLSKFHPYSNNQSVWFPKTSSPGPPHPPATVVYTVYIFIYVYIYIQRKLSLRESATTNKFWTAWEMLQPMLRQIGWHCILAKICSQRISFQRRSRLNQCTSSITQHVTPACYSTLRHSITYLHAIRGYPLFHTQKEIDDGAILLKKLYVSSDTPKGKCTSSLHDMAKNGDGFPTNLRFRNPFQICSFLLLQPRHMIYLNVHALRTRNNPVRRLVAR